MSHPFAEIILNSGAESYEFENGFDGEKRLRPLAKVNVFVGANNSGKSRLMRTLAATPKMHVLPNLVMAGEGISYEKIQTVLEEAKAGVLNALVQAQCQDVNGIRVTVNKFPLKRILNEGEGQIGDCISVLEGVSSMKQVNQYTGHQPDFALRLIQGVAQGACQQLALISNDARSIPETKKLYIPTLRSLRDLGQDDAFAERTRKDYFANTNHVELFTGRTLYDEIEQLVRGNLEQRETLREFETWIGEAFFRGAPVAIIPRKGDTSLTVKIGNEKEQPIHNLGDGIQAILILAFPLFVRKEEHLLAFIEEPELFLHPWLQRVLLEMMSNRFPRHQYFLTTHSNHFLDLTLDAESVSVFAFQKHLEESGSKERPPRYTVTNVSRSDRRPLELLGVRNSSVLLTNCTIWVEGITDRRYIAHWLDLFQQQFHGNTAADRAKFFKEDLHYSFVEYSGGNITHWSFLDETGPEVERLCGKLFLIADSDGAKPKSAKGKRHAKLSEKLAERFLLLPTKEIENLLTPACLSSVLEAYGESRDNLQMPKQESYATKALGTFIDEKFFKDPALKNRTASYADDSGTVSDKVKFCERAIAAMKTFDCLSPLAQDLAKRVHGFIQKENPKAVSQ
ncbi:MAG: ATP-binding protein [Chthoniobacter sp.]|nr:ATP-binding protein [Chthoniobacter sp.]